MAWHSVARPRDWRPFRRTAGGRRPTLAARSAIGLARILHLSSRRDPILWEVRAPVELELSQDLSPLQSARVSARLVAANYILELSSLELQQAISTELSDNPALEMIDVPTCPVCGTELQGSVCPRCLQRQKGDVLSPPLADGGYEEQIHQPVGAIDEEFDPLTLVAAEETLAERLLADLGSLLDDEDMRIAEFLVGSLDDKGYLSCTVDEVAYELEVDARRVRRVLETLQ